jgi:tetratricopeptide (TPR) repeat protein
MHHSTQRVVTRPPRARGLSPTSQSAFAAAVQHHQAGHLHQAESLYRQVLATSSRHADSLHLLGVLALQVGRYDLAVDLIKQAIVIDATPALYHCNLGNALKATHQLEQAAASYRRAIALKPDDYQAYNNLGATLHVQCHLAEAEACLRKAIALHPDGPDAHNNLGNVLIDQGRVDEAIACYRSAIDLWPGDPRAHSNLGAALQDRGDLEAAALCYQKALALRPDIAETHSNLGLVLKRLGRLDEAAACCRKAIAHRRDLPQAYDTLGATLADQGKLDEAATCYRKALALWPADPQLHDNIGTVLKGQGLLDPAIASFRAAIACAPERANAHYNLAVALLARGDLVEGWQEYEWRWQTTAMAASRRRFTQPQWHGEPADGASLLIHAEQGLGDTIQFSRYASLAAARGLRVIMQVPDSLVRLLRGVTGVDQVLGQSEDLPHCDLHCPMQSLPLAFGTTLETIPSAPSWFQPDAALAEAWRARLDAMDRPVTRIGLAWAGSAAMVRDRDRSLAPEQLAPLLDLPRIHFVSLQKATAPPRQNLSDFMAEMNDFADTAALIVNLDLVIAVDTAVAHLAASLGKPVWLLDRFDPDWRWLLGRRDSPWYPGLRLYRQPRPGDWYSVLAEVSEDVCAFERRASVD